MKAIINHIKNLICSAKYRQKIVLSAIGMIWCLAIFPGCSSTAHSVDSPLTGLIHFYRGPLNHLSAVRTGECPMYPGCSEYALTAIEKHGSVIGWIMACDRLMRCGHDETELSPKIIVDGHWRTYDTVAQNDFWWHERDNINPIPLSDFEQLQDWKISIE